VQARYRFSNALRYRAEDHPNNTALTPSYILEPAREDLGGSIGLDPCSTDANPTDAERFYCPPQDGAELAWDAASIFVNPPYGRARERWVTRCIKAGSQGRKVVLLIPAHPDTLTFQRAARSASAVVFIRGRVKFGEFGQIRPNGRQVAASHGSVLLGWNTMLPASAPLGLLMNPVREM